jgi:hypothetical protein
MFQRAEYQHPTLLPFSMGSWGEVILAWVAAAVCIGLFVVLA